MNNLMAETQRLMREWEVENPMWCGKITHDNIKNVPISVLDERLEYINAGLKALGFIK